MPLEPTEQNLAGLCEIVENTLPALRFFPAGTGGVAVARLVGKLVNSLEEARRLCELLVEEYDEWPGPATLRAHYLQLFHKDVMYPEGRGWEKPAINCKACQDFGYRTALGGRFVRCECVVGQELPGDLLTLLNRPPAQTMLLDRPRRRGAASTPATPEEEREVLGRALTEHQARLEVRGNRPTTPLPGADPPEAA